MNRARSIHGALVLVALLLMANGVLSTAMPMRMAHAGIDATWMAALGSAGFAGSIFGMPLAVWMVRTWGGRMGFVLLAIGMGAMFAIAAGGSSVLGLLLIRCLAGVLLAALTVILESRFNRMAGSACRSRILARYMMVFYVAQAAGAIIPASMNNIGISLVLGAGLVWVAAVLGLSGPRELPRPASEPKTEWAWVKPVLPGLMFALLVGSVLGCMYGLGPVYAHAMLGKAGIPLYMAMAMGGGLCGIWLSGHLADHIGATRTGMIWTGLLAGLSAWLCIVPLHHHAPTLVAAAGTGALVFAIYPLGSALVNARIAKSMRIAANGIYVLLVGVGGLVGPLLAMILMPVLAARSGFGVMAGSALLALMCIRWQARIDQIAIP